MRAQLHLPALDLSWVLLRVQLHLPFLNPRASPETMCAYKLVTASALCIIKNKNKNKAKTTKG